MKRRVLIAVAVVGLLGAATAGYALGVGAAPTEAEAANARAEALSRAQHQAEEAAYEEARERGLTRGLATGRRNGAHVGLVAGRNQGASKAEAALAESQAEAAESAPAPGTPGSTVCVAYQDYVPGVGCTPPVAPGETAADPGCPPGQIPVGVTGACAPE